MGGAYWIGLLGRETEGYISRKGRRLGEEVESRRPGGKGRETVAGKKGREARG